MYKGPALCPLASAMVVLCVHMSTAVDVCCYKVLCCLLSPCSLQQGSCQDKLTFGLISISLNLKAALKTLTLIYS